MKSEEITPWSKNMRADRALRRIFRVSRRAGRGHTVVRVPSLSSVSSGRQHLVGLIWTCQQAVQLVVLRRAAGSTTGRTRRESRSYSTVRTPPRRRVFRAQAPPQGPLENLMGALRLLANLQKIFEGLQEQSRFKISRHSSEWTNRRR